MTKPNLTLALVVLAATLVFAATVKAHPTATYRASSESRVLVLLNAERAKHGLTPFTLDRKLTAASRAHSGDMLRSGYFAHDGAQRWDARVRSFTGSRTVLAENIAFGSGTYGTPAGLVNSWMHSPGHRANILRKSLHRIGIGIAAGSYRGTPGVAMATTDFSS